MLLNKLVFVAQRGAPVVLYVRIALSVLSIGSFASVGSALSSLARWSLMSHRTRFGLMDAPGPDRAG